MAGAGYKLFATGDVLTASDVNTYLQQQTVMVFDDAAARTTALTGVVSEGMVSYLKSTNAVEVYDGSNWVASDDPNAIQNTIVDAKGDLISATGSDVPARLAVGANETRLVADSAQSTGLKYVADTTNYAIAAKGDLLAGTAADTVAALTVGANDTVLTADSSTATGLKWAAPGANWSLLNAGGTALTGATTITVSGISNVDKIMAVVIGGSTVSTASPDISFRLNTDSGSNYIIAGLNFTTGINGYGSLTETSIRFATQGSSAANTFSGGITITGCNSSGLKQFIVAGSSAGTNSQAYITEGLYNSASTISSVSVFSSTGNFDAGSVYIYTSK